MAMEVDGFCEGETKELEEVGKVLNRHIYLFS